VTGLNNGITYTFTVTATNAWGTGSPSSPSNSVKPGPTVPGAPTAATATAGDSQTTVTFSPPASNGGSPITGYTVISYPSGGVDANSGSTATTHSVTNLTNGTAYDFTVTATNAVGTGPTSAPSNIVTPHTLLPGAPTGVSATPGDATAWVSFTPPTSNGGSAIKGYTVTSYPSGGVDTNAGTTSTNHTVTQLTNGTAYTFTVTATNAVGPGQSSSPSGSVTPTASPTPPSAPLGVSATPGNAGATVSFSPPESNGNSAITGYIVTSNPGNIVTRGAASPISVSRLTNGTSYVFTVTATNRMGAGLASAPSNSVTPATIPGAPTNLVANAGSGQATLTFKPPASNGGSPITGYIVTSCRGTSYFSSGSPANVSGLTNGTSYKFTVRAVNFLGVSPASLPSNSVTPVKKVVTKAKTAAPRQ
jgi:hypothetical protein